MTTFSTVMLDPGFNHSRTGWIQHPAAAVILGLTQNPEQTSWIPAFAGMTIKKAGNDDRNGQNDEKEEPGMTTKWQE
jgi:hypothetical protein